ncbi:alpha-glucosidase [Bryocella elongata]|uniref:Alpha-glucosidase n=1 Tax=Bryocella elongata TaxID=863522 RepID=A0A1H5TEP1_9BACT|nr:TIM-barrel domain-containing protein [Bryocella elongata]SEF61276.1 alpha-glucosidase [Bryocella elongata]
MVIRRTFRSLSAIVVLAASAVLQGQTAPSGMTRTSGDLTVRIDALREDVLRVRVWRSSKPAEDASWAVLPGSRVARVPVSLDPDGFHTPKLRVVVGADLRIKVTDLSGNVLHEDVLPPVMSDDGIRITRAHDLLTHEFGLGDKPGPLDRAGETFVMWNTDNFGWQESSDPIYKSIPFFLEERGGRYVGFFLDNTFRTSFDFGRERVERNTITAPDGPIDYYLLYGPEPKAVLGEYAWLTGPTPLPPLWSLGFQQSRYSYSPQSQVEDIAAHLRRDHIPADVLWLDIDYQLKNRPFTVDPDRFPDFAGMIHKLAEDHFRTVIITDLHIAHLPNQGYAPYDSGEAGDNFVKEGGKEYVGPVWPGPSVFPDFTRKSTRDWWGTLYKDFVHMGVAGFWNDMNEPAVFVYPTKTMPDDVEHRIAGAESEGFAPRTAFHSEMHNVYGMENSRATHDGQLMQAPNLRPFVMTRASFAGGQRYAVTWTGDNSSTWNHLRQTTPQLLNLGLSGFSMSGADVGGFAGSPSPELLTRWLMLAAFQPIDRDHAVKGSRPHEPWADGPEHEAIRRRFIEERYKLMPYLYTAAEETSLDGVPIVRPLFVDFPRAAADGHPMDLDGGGEFLFGPSILVADNPSPEEVAPYEVHLPPGVWYDYWTGERLDRRAPATARDLEIRDAVPSLKPVMVEPKLDKLPVYVRAGAIVPLQPLVQSTAEKPVGSLTLRVYAPSAGEPCAGDLYQDDGVSFNFEKGEFLRLHVSCNVAADGAVMVQIPAREGRFRPWWSTIRLEIVGASTAAVATVNGHSASVERGTGVLAVSLEDKGMAQTVVIR